MKLVHTVYISDFNGDVESSKDRLAKLSPFACDLTIDYRRMLMDASWQFVDDEFREKVFREKFFPLVVSDCTLWCTV